jgi:hypothetical protein
MRIAVLPRTCPRIVPVCAASACGSISALRKNRILISFLVLICLRISSHTTSVQPFLPIQTVGFSSTGGSFSFTMLHQRIPLLSFTPEAGDYHFLAVNTHPRGYSRYHIRVTGAAVASTQIGGDANSVPHGDAAGKVHIPVREAGIGRECFFRLVEKDSNPLPCDPLNVRTC